MAFEKRGSLRFVSKSSSIENDNNIPELVSTGEADTRRSRAATTSNLDLEARNIRLRLSSTSVQRNRLSTHKVVTRCQALGHSKGPLSAVGVQDLSTPGSGGTRVSVLGDLEERSRCGRLCVGHLGHVDQDGAVVVAADGGLAALAVSGLGVHFDG